ncbi:MAG: hypothetical protein ACPHL6_10495, partial [Rubripirellula sp.]
MHTLCEKRYPLTAFLSFLTIALFIGPLAFSADTIPLTEPLTENRPLDVVMVEGIDRFALRAIEDAKQKRIANWARDVFESKSPTKAQEYKRQDFAKIIGCTEQRVHDTQIQTIATIDQSSMVESNSVFAIHHVRWSALNGIDAEGYFLKPRGKILARVVAIPDADWNPEQICGLSESPTRYAADLAAMGCEVLVPTVVNRGNEYSSNPNIQRFTNLSHREFIYRQAFELGRHIIGYEVQKVLAAVDIFEDRNKRHGKCPIGVCGVGEGGLLAFYSSAIDTRIDATLVSGYFNQRDNVWQEPIYRNVWRLLENFGDAQIAAMIAPRSLMIEVNPNLPIPSELPDRGRRVAAPGQITRPDPALVKQELKLAQKAWDVFSTQDSLHDGGSGKLRHKILPEESSQPISSETVLEFIRLLLHDAPAKIPRIIPDYTLKTAVDTSISANRQKRAITQMTAYTQRLLQLSHRTRDAYWNQLDRSS